MTQPDDFADHLGALAAGNSALVGNPRVLNGLASAGATPAQAQSVNQFLLALSAQTMVASTPDGHVAPLSGPQSTALSGLNQAGPQQTATAPPAQGGGGWSFGRIFHDITHNPVTDAIGATGRGIQTAANVVPTSISYLTGSSKYQTDPAVQAEMKAQGYDPSSYFSVIAFQASGKDRFGIDQLYKKNDPNTVNEAIKFANDPDAYTKTLYATQDPDQLAANLNMIKSKNFQDLVTQLNARNPTLGNIATIGIDPVKHPKEQKLLAAGVDTAVSFVADPVLIAGKGLAVYRATEIGLDSAGDGSRVYDVISGAKKGLYANQVRTGISSFLADTKTIREASAAGDHAAAAAALAHIHSATPGLEHMIDDFNGSTRAVGLYGDKTVFGEGKAVETLGEAAEFLSSKVGLVRYMSGKAGSEIGLMPGQLSKFGVKALRGNLAAAAVKAGSQRVIDLTKPAVLEKLLAKPGDAVETATGKVVDSAADEAEAIGQPLTTGQLASQLRAAAADRGDALFASRKGLGPVAAINRIRLGVQRATSFLPRSTTFDITATNTTRDVVNYAKTYLTASDANLLGAAYAAADAGTRKAILSGLGLQVAHAAGLGTTEGGRDVLATLSREFSTHQYSLTAGKFIDPATNMERDAALFPSDVQELLTLPSFRELQQQGAKIGLWENTVGRVFNAPMTDALMKVVKALWLIRPTNVVRNSGEDLFGAFLRGELGHVLMAKRVADKAALLPKRTKLGNLTIGPVMRVTSMYAAARIKQAGESLGLHYIADLSPEELANLADNFAQYHVRGMIDPNGSQDLSDIAQAGMMPAKMTFNAKRTGFKEQEAVGEVGAIRYAQHLGRVYDGNKEIASRILKGGPTTRDDVVAMLKADPRVKQMTRASLFKDDDGTWTKAATEAEKHRAITDLADAQVKEVGSLVANKDGSVNQKIVDYLNENGHAPSTDWITSNLSDEERPAAVLAPMFQAIPPKPGVTGFVEAAADLTGKAYQSIVERPINRISTMPIFLSNYGKMRVFLKPIEDMHVADGMTKEAASKVVTEQAMQMAWTRTLKYIDDPTLRTALDITGRNFFAFSRATQAFIRRWSTQLVEDPARLRKAQLAYEGGVRTGLIYNDADGNKQFVFPGSGLAIEGLMKLQNLIPGLNVVRVPGVVPNLTSKVAFLNPGLANPLQMSATPLVNIPYRAVETLFPQHRVTLDKIDAWVNGTSGQGQSALHELEPSFLRPFLDASKTDANSLTADAMRGAILNLYAAGKLPSQAKDAAGNPLPVDSAKMQEFLSNVQAQTQNQMVYRALFSLFSPAPPGTPTESNSASAADWFYGAQGISGMQDEWKKILNDTGGDYAQAAQIWTDLHPDLLAFTTPTTQVGSKNSTIQATAAANQWITNNLDFLQAYKGTAAYFLPAQANQGAFDDGAYRAELELGLRQKKTTADFANDVATAQATSAFFKAIDLRDQTLAAHPDQKSTITANFQKWEANFNAVNPLFAASQQDFSAAQQTAGDQLSQLRRMVADPDVPKDVPTSLVNQMIGAYDTYHNVYNQIAAQPHPQTNAADATRALIAGNYSAWMQKFVAAHPELGGLYAGVFRTLDNKVLDPIGSQ